MRIIVSNNSNDPIYLQIYNQIRDAIIRGDLAPGEALPSIRNLAKDLNISAITTKRAYDDLEAGGYLSSVGGKGTYVSDGNPQLLRETRLRLIEEKLAEAVNAARSIGLNAADIGAMLDLIVKEE